jgi:hypothetical protein
VYLSIYKRKLERHPFNELEQGANGRRGKGIEKNCIKVKKRTVWHKPKIS